MLTSSVTAVEAVESDADKSAPSSQPNPTAKARATSLLENMTPGWKALYQRAKARDLASKAE